MIQSKKKLYEFLEMTAEELNVLLDQIESLYKIRLQPKIKFGKPQMILKPYCASRVRQLIIPFYKLKNCQHKLNALLQQITLPYYFHGSITGKSNVTNAFSHIENDYFLTVDIKNFFPRINNNIVYHTLVKLGFSADVSRILTKLTTTKRQLPQGAPTSTTLANLVMLNTSHKLYTLAKTNNIQLTVFLDDLTFSSKAPFKNLVNEFLLILNKENYKIAHNKINYSNNICEITGIFIKGKKLSLSYKMQNKAKRNKEYARYNKYIQEYQSKHIG